MFKPRLSLHRTFKDSSLWKPALRFTTLVVRRRRYRILHKDGMLTIERTFNDWLDFMIGSEQVKLWSIAKGTINWEGTTAQVELEIDLMPFPKLVFWVMQLFLVTFPVFFLLSDWKFALSLGMVLMVFALFNWAFVFFVLKYFLKELSSDIEHFKVNETTTWEEGA